MGLLIHKKATPAHAWYRTRNHFQLSSTSIELAVSTWVHAIHPCEQIWHVYGFSKGHIDAYAIVSMVTTCRRSNNGLDNHANI